MSDLYLQELDFSKAAIPLTDSEISSRQKCVPDWKVITSNNSIMLQRTFPFNNFRQAMVFTNLVAELSESVNHHPSLLSAWGKVTVTWWSHSASGVHHNDFIMAAKTDVVFNNL